MDEKRDAAGGDGGPEADADTARRIEFTGRLKAMLYASATDLGELDKAAKAIGGAAKTGQLVRDLEAYDTPSGADDGPMDFADEERLRAGILGRLDAVAASLVQAGVDPCPACGRFDLDRERLEQLVRARAEASGDAG